MKERLTKYCSLVSLIALAVSQGCIEPISIDVPRLSHRYIVEGLLTDNQEFQSVRVRLVPDNEIGFIEVEGAVVEIERLDGSRIGFPQAAPGYYLPESAVTLQETGQYRLSIEIGDTVHIVSGWQKVPPAMELTGAYFQPVRELDINDNGYYVPTNGFAYYVTTGFSNATDTYLRYSYQSAYIMESPLSSSLCPDCTGCYIVANARDFVKTAFVENQQRKKLSNYQIAFVRSSYEYSILKTLRILQFSINRDTHNYYSLIEQQKNLDGTVFDPPPAVLKGNLADVNEPDRVIYGFFEVSRLAERSVRVRASDAPFFIRRFEEICTPFNLNTSPECADCRLKAGATHERPVWF